MIYRVSFAALVFATSVFVASAEPVKSLPGEDGRIPVAERESRGSLVIWGFQNIAIDYLRKA
jgi:hypothetical protein